MKWPVFRTAAVAAINAAALAGCGGSAGDRPPLGELASAGQVQPAASTASRVSFYAASRFAEQATFGPTPELVEEIRAKGFEKWIDEQFALPVSQPIYGFSEEWDKFSGDRWYYSRGEILRMFSVERDQLRLRTTWALSQFVVISLPDGMLRWWNLLQAHALGNYRNLLYETAIHPVMGAFLNNNQNRPKSPSCPQCAPNENFARELLQLFSIGPIVLESDGRSRRDGLGQPLESYSQADVEELARALTGWRFDPNPSPRPAANWGNWTKPMVPSTVPDERDSGTKQILGKRLPAGQPATKDLADVVELLTSHPNIGPFVALRMIQHLVKSDPSPDYVSRVAEAFRNNGAGVVGDMKAVVKAVLLDPEARAGDTPGPRQGKDGKIREPMLHRMAIYRGLGCQQAIVDKDGKPADPQTQVPLYPGTVFGFYSPHDRSPGSNLLSPEEKLLSTFELMWRFRGFTPGNDIPAWRAAGCGVDVFARALQKSPRDFTDLLGQRFFRGAISPVLRRSIEAQITARGVTPSTVNTVALGMIGFALGSPFFGAIQ